MQFNFLGLTKSPTFASLQSATALKKWVIGSCWPFVGFTVELHFLGVTIELRFLGVTLFFLGVLHDAVPDALAKPVMQKVRVSIGAQNGLEDYPQPIGHLFPVPLRVYLHFGFYNVRWILGLLKR
jgi:hypothetical protein